VGRLYHKEHGRWKYYLFKWENCPIEQATWTWFEEQNAAGKRAIQEFERIHKNDEKIILPPAGAPFKELRSHKTEQRVADSIFGASKQIPKDVAAPLAYQKAVTSSRTKAFGTRLHKLEDDEEARLMLPKQNVSGFGVLSTQIDSAIKAWNNSFNFQAIHPTKTIVGSYKRFLKHSDGAKKYLKKSWDITIPKAVAVDPNTLHYFSVFPPGVDIVEESRDPSDHPVENLEYYLLQWNELDEFEGKSQRHEFVPVYEAALYVEMKEIERWEDEKFAGERPTKMALHDRYWARYEAQLFKETALKEAKRKPASVNS
jgi:hypothetical protein